MLRTLITQSEIAGLIVAFISNDPYFDRVARRRVDHCFPSDAATNCLRPTRLSETRESLWSRGVTRGR